MPKLIKLWYYFEAGVYAEWVESQWLRRFNPDGVTVI